LSFGVQSFDDGCLERLGRIHDSATADAAVHMARDAGFDNFNIDLMYALPGQDVAMAGRDVERALALQPTPVSHYQLPLEPNTTKPGTSRSTASSCWPKPVTSSTRSPPMPGPAANARTTSTTGASATTWASAPARTAS